MENLFDLKAIIFDLDDTLLDTTQLLIPIRHSPLFLQTISMPLPLMEGAAQTLQALSQKFNLYLLTQGKPEYQSLKVKNTGIEYFFNKIYFVNPELSQTKEEFFLKIMTENDLQANYVMSIGNRTLTDIGPAKKIGLKTCWFAYGEHLNEAPLSDFEKADHVVYNHSQLLNLFMV